MAAARRVFSDGKLNGRDRRLIRVESAAATVGLRHVIFRKISASQSSEKNGNYGSIHVSPSCGDREQLDVAVRHFPSALSQQMRILNEEYLGLQEELELHQQELQSVKDHLDDLERMVLL
uniref:Uncharacterized protein n=1 Tax=Strigamia maritima TaxID=126957 RepID=T1JEL9_STRMM